MNNLLIINKHKLCLNCFLKFHLAANCVSKYLLQILHYLSHNSILHKNKSIASNNNESRHQKTDAEQTAAREKESSAPAVVSQNHLSNWFLSSNTSVILSTEISLN